MTLDTNFLVGLFAGLIVMWLFDWYLYGREKGGDQTREIDDLRQELAIYKKARTTAEANLQTAEGEIESLRQELTVTKREGLVIGESREKLAAAEAEIARLRLQLEEATRAVTREKAEAAAGQPPAPGAGATGAGIKIDDLKAIEGIGPKIETILHHAGIKTFAQLAASSVAALEKIVREDGGIKIAFPDTWPQQAGLAAAGKWDELERFQDSLKGGRRV